METDANDARIHREERPNPPDGPSVTYSPREDATPEGEIVALANVFAFVIRAHDAKEAAASLGKHEEGGEHEAAAGPEPANKRSRR